MRLLGAYLDGLRPSRRRSKTRSPAPPPGAVGGVDPLMRVAGPGPGASRRGVALGVAIAVASQLVILVSTLLSYALGIETYFNHPTALNVEQAVPASQALGIRGVGLIANSVLNAVAAALGWALGGLLPQRQ